MTRPIVSRADAAALALSVDRMQREPLHIQLGHQLRRMILSGRIAPGSKLPSSRALALDLEVSRTTVVLSYDQLTSEGYIEGRQGAGVFVSPSLPEQALHVAAPSVQTHTRCPQPAKLKPPEQVRPFQLGATDPTLFPYKRWARLLYRFWRDPAPALTGTMDPFGWLSLREAIARHLKEWRGIVCHAGRIIITSGTVDATELIARCAFKPGDTVYIEEPGYPTLRRALLNHGITTAPVLVDVDGFDPARAFRGGAARGAFVTPSRQFPLGATLPLARRLELLEWVAAARGYIVEDDFDSEYRYQGSPLPALMSLDGNGRTIYIGSFSKVLSPALRLGFVVVPERLIETVRQHLRQRGSAASLVAQPVLAEFIAEGSYAIHIRRTRRIYAHRMAALVAQAHRLEGLLEVAPTSAGMHVVADLAPRLGRRMSDREAVARAGSAGVTTSALSGYCALRPRRRALLLGFAGFAEQSIERAIGRLADALR